ncbi:hypothetical protein ACFV6F_08475, partial [Kitasatospora phosalacinea]
MRKLSVLGVLAAVLAALLALAGPAAAAGPTGWTTANSDATGDQDTSAVAVDRLGDHVVVGDDVTLGVED